MELFKLMGSIFVDSDAAEKSISKTDEKANNLGKNLGKGIKTAAKFGAALVAGAGVAIGGMVALGIKIGNTADEILDLNSITGMSTDSIQEWRKVAEVAGVNTDAMANASMKLTKNMDAMTSETHKGNEALGKLGFSLSDLENMSADERMNVLTEAIAGVDDKTERAKIGTDLFGGSWKEIAPIVDLGAEAMNKAKDSANIISEEDLKKANDFRISVEDMKEKLAFFATEIGIKVMPALQVMMDWIAEKMPLIQSGIETAMEYAGAAIEKIGSVITDTVIPKFQELYAWIEPHLPAIKGFFEDAFGVVQELFEKLKDAVKVLGDNLNILLPIIVGVTGAIVAQLIINSVVSAYKAWRAATVAQTTVQWLLNAAMSANPIGLVALAIGALIAVGILLWQNWDVVKEKAGQLWSFLTTKFTEIRTVVVNKVKELAVQALGFFVSLYTGAIEKFNALKSGTSAIISALKTVIVNKIKEAATNSINKIIEMKNSIVGKFDEVRSSAVTKFNAVKDAILKPINSARDAVGTAVDKIKGFFTGMKLNLPKIKVPSFSLKNWSKNPVDWIGNMPSIGINWNAKGALFTKPTVFNTPMGLQGFGEAGPEAALPLTDRVLGTIGKSIAATMGAGGQQIKISPAPIYFDSQWIGEATFDVNQDLFGSASTDSAWMKGVK